MVLSVTQRSGAASVDLTLWQAFSGIQHENGNTHAAIKTLSRALALLHTLPAAVRSGASSLFVQLAFLELELGCREDAQHTLCALAEGTVFIPARKQRKVDPELVPATRVLAARRKLANLVQRTSSSPDVGSRHSAALILLEYLACGRDLTRAKSTLLSSCGGRKDHYIAVVRLRLVVVLLSALGRGIG